jgi:hypothetical protein
VASRTIGDRVDAALVARLLAINGTAAASSTISATSAAGTSTVNVVSSTGFYGESDNKPQRERVIIIGKGTAREEVHTVTAVAAGALTIQGVLVYDHTLAQGDAVKQNWFNRTIDHVKSWAEIEDDGPEAPFAVGSLIMLGENRVGYEGAYERKARDYGILVIDEATVAEPIDQTNDRIFQELEADLEKTLMDDPTLGGLIMEYHLGRREPRKNEPEEGDTSEIPLVGCFADLEIQYRHLRGCLYA